MEPDDKNEEMEHDKTKPAPKNEEMDHDETKAPSNEQIEYGEKMRAMRARHEEEQTQRLGLSITSSLVKPLIDGLLKPLVTGLWSMLQKYLQSEEGQMMLLTLVMKAIEQVTSAMSQRAVEEGAQVRARGLVAPAMEREFLYLTEAVRYKGYDNADVHELFTQIIKSLPDRSPHDQGDEDGARSTPK